MNWLETARTSLAAVRSHRLRSLLTMLGILIGIAAVMLTVGLGEGAQKQVRDQINALGSNLLVVTPGSSTSSSGVRGGFGSASTLTTADATALDAKAAARTSPRSRRPRRPRRSSRPGRPTGRPASSAPLRHGWTCAPAL